MDQKNEKEIKLIDQSYLEAIIYLTQHLNPQMKKETLRQRQSEMFSYETNRCFGLFKQEKLIGVASAWITTRVYSGKQLELDNVIIDPGFRSNGLGKQLLEYIEKWALENNFLNVELNAFVENKNAHKFYARRGYEILGHHFVKELLQK